MIATLSGTLSEKAPDRLVVDVGGVGYDVQIPLSTFYAVGEPGADVVLRIHTHVREDTLSLYGFATRLELDLFERLIGVNGVGPRVALSVLSGIEPPELVRAIRTADTTRLTRIPGIGRKTAARIGLELKDKLSATVLLGQDEAGGATAEDSLGADVVSALLNLGYHRAQAEKAVTAALGAAPVGFEATLRQALRELAG